MTAQRRHFIKRNFIRNSLLLPALLFAAFVPALADDNVAGPTASSESMATEPMAADQGEDSQRGSVARAIFTSQIVDREPTDDLTTIATSQDRIYFFTDLRNLEGQIVTHRWEYKGEVMAEVKFQVGGPRWRVYSSKNLLPEWTGQWTVIITDESGWPIKASVFDYLPAGG